ncbi:LysR family transcriptional regulator [Rubrivivax sp. A210]|uniref:helix-turn-helix transcriptional regulator n=1 Tax=Rubrivivax sp. A210 TaxID=2772301 RepID=UPI00191AFD24|nr:substrate-binding domain-containing protein [Rubrivivax sp. A210]CAD5374774.1 LysR family transcriptional regulator [Rubrivivax sp. A210]
MKSRGVQLHYQFGADSPASRQGGADVDNPLFDLLSALAAAGSIQHAALALGVSYRHLWGSLKSWEEQLGEALVTWVRGQPARLTPFAERLLWAERQARVRMAPHIEALRHELQRVLDEALDGSRQVLRVDASHDLLLPQLQALAVEQRRLHIELRFAGTLDALRSLAQGRCLVAGFHVPLALDRGQAYARALRPLLKPGVHKLIAGMRRRQGLIVAAGNPLAVAGLADVVGRGLRFAGREPGSGTHLLAEHLAEQAGVDLARLAVSAVENSHLAVATAVASGAAEVGLGLEAAAAASALGFVPLVEEEYFLVCLADTLEQPAVLALREALASAAWREAVQARAGYSAAPAAGQVLSLTRALPWWQFRKPRTAA